MNTVSMRACARADTPAQTATSKGALAPEARAHRLTLRGAFPPPRPESSSAARAAQRCRAETTKRLLPRSGVGARRDASVTCDGQGRGAFFRPRAHFFLEPPRCRLRSGSTHARPHDIAPRWFCLSPGSRLLLNPVFRAMY